MASGLGLGFCSRPCKKQQQTHRPRPPLNLTCDGVGLRKRGAASRRGRVDRPWVKSSSSSQQCTMSSTQHKAGGEVNGRGGSGGGAAGKPAKAAPAQNNHSTGGPTANKASTSPAMHIGFNVPNERLLVGAQVLIGYKVEVQVRLFNASFHHLPASFPLAWIWDWLGKIQHTQGCREGGEATCTPTMDLSSCVCQCSVSVVSVGRGPHLVTSGYNIVGSCLRVWCCKGLVCGGVVVVGEA